MTPEPKHPAIVTRTPLAAALLLSLLAAGCASDGPIRPEPPTRYETLRPERVVPDDVAAMRETFADQRTTTLESMDAVMGRTQMLTTDDGSPWYSTLFDALDTVVGIGGLFW